MSTRARGGWVEDFEYAFPTWGWLLPAPGQFCRPDNGEKRWGIEINCLKQDKAVSSLLVRRISHRSHFCIILRLKRRKPRPSFNIFPSWGMQPGVVVVVYVYNIVVLFKKWKLRLPFIIEKETFTCRNFKRTLPQDKMISGQTQLMSIWESNFITTRANTGHAVPQSTSKPPKMRWRNGPTDRPTDGQTLI